MRKGRSSTIAILGAGYVGLSTSVLFAESGHKVFALDVNQDRLTSLRKGRSFFYEHGINPLIKHSVESGRLVPTDSYKEGVGQADFVFSCVGTPDNPDGSSNLSYVFGAAEQAAKYMKPGSVYVQKSTVPVGTGKKIQANFPRLKKQRIAYVSNPEFLREGTAIADSLWPDRVVVGSDDRSAAESVAALHETIVEARDEIAARAGISHPLAEPPPVQHLISSLNSAELIKVSANAFLALKISFANSIAKLTDQTDADIKEVMDGIGQDRRIGRAFLNAGRGYGGGCFPKDVSGLISSASEHGVNLQIMEAAADVNESMPGYIANKAKGLLGGLAGKRVAVLGLAFKAGTSDIRRSPGVKLANILSKERADVRVYDPQANEEANGDLHKSVRISDSIESAVKESDAVFIATDWPEFIGYDLKSLAKLLSGKLFVDCVNEFVVDEVRAAGLQYVGVGR